MAAKLCCTAPQRTDSPELPNAREVSRNATPTAPSPGNHEELRAIFEAASDTPEKHPVAGATRFEGSQPNSARFNESPRRTSLIGKLKKKISKGHTRSASPRLLTKPSKGKSTLAQEHEDTKAETIGSLLNSGSRGGYDSDAHSMPTRRSSLTLREEIRMSPVRGRRAHPRPALRDTLWGSRIPSTSVTGSLQSLIYLLTMDSTRSFHLHTADGNEAVRKASQVTMIHAPRSQSVNGIPKPHPQEAERRQEAQRSRSESPSRTATRRASSEAFPSAIDYITALQALAADMSQREQAEQEARQRFQQDGELDLPSVRTSNVSTTSYKSAVTTINDATVSVGDLLQSETSEAKDQTPKTISETDLALVNPASSVRGQALHSREETDPFGGGTSSRESIHLWSMRISQHLRTTSFATQQTAIVASPTKPHLRSASSSSDLVTQIKTGNRLRRQLSSSGFTSGRVPATWGNVLSDTASSVYSSRDHTPALDSPTPYSPDRIPAGKYELPMDYLPRGRFPKIRLGDSEGAQTITSGNYDSMAGRADEHVREVTAAMPAESTGPEGRLLSPPMEPRKVPHDNKITRSPLTRAGSSASNVNEPGSSRSSKFREEEEQLQDPCTSKGRFTRRPSVFNMFRPSKSKPIVTSDNTTVSARYDGPADCKGKGKEKEKGKQSVGQPTQRSRAKSLGIHATDEASNLFAKALVANQEEKSALLLPEHRDMLRVPLYAPRERSVSVSLRSGSISSAAGSKLPSPHPSAAGSKRPSPNPSEASGYFSPPKFATPQFLVPEFNCSPPASPGRSSTFLDPLDNASVISRVRARRRSSAAAPNDSVMLNTPVEGKAVMAEATETSLPLPQIERRLSTAAPSEVSVPALHIETPSAQYSSEDSTVADLGAWARYPSHTRKTRTGSAGQADNVFTRDFALELLRARPLTEYQLEDGTDDSPTLKSKKRGKHRVSFVMSKSKSLTLEAKRVFKGYSQMFKSQSLEFMTHGHGHRTSISSGGVLEHPELEVLPAIFREYDRYVDEFPANRCEHVPLQSMARNSDGTTELAEIREADSIDAGLKFDGAADIDRPRVSEDWPLKRQQDPFVITNSAMKTPAPNAARLWSQLYASCVELPSSRTATPSGSLSSDGSQGSPARQKRGISRRTASSPTSMRPESPCLRLSPPSETRVPSIASLQRTKSPSDNDVARLSGTKKRKRGASKRRLHGKNDSIVSVRSLRESTNDLCVLLIETEKREKDRLLKTAEALVHAI